MSLSLLLTSSSEINQLIRNLRQAAKKSRHSGGGRTVTIHDSRDPNKRVFLEICLGREARLGQR